MRLHKYILQWALLLAMAVALSACGSSSHHNGSDSENYSGNDQPVGAVNSDNAQGVGQGAAEGARQANASQDAPDSIPLAAQVASADQKQARARQIADIVRNIASQGAPDFATGASHNESGACSGTAKGTASNDGDIDVTFKNYNDNSDCSGSTVDGHATGTNTVSDNVTTQKLHFDPGFKVTDNDTTPPETTTFEGDVTVVTDSSSRSYKITFNNFKETDADGNVTTYENLTCSTSLNGCTSSQSFTDADGVTYKAEGLGIVPIESTTNAYQVSADKVCHPDIGCFGMQTVQPLTFCDDTGYPGSGKIAIMPLHDAATGVENVTAAISDSDDDTTQTSGSDVPGDALAVITFSQCSPTTVTVSVSGENLATLQLPPQEESQETPTAE